MRLLPVWVLAVAGWVAAAAPGLRSQEVPQGEDLGPALRDLARRKRAGSKSNLPYSNYRPVTGIHRYRYPLYRKRSYQPQYDYEDDVLLPEEEEREFSDYVDYLPRPSLFRERNHQQQERKKGLLMENDGFYTDDDVPEKSPLYNMPASDLERLNYIYDMIKRNSDPISPYDVGGPDQIHEVGRKTVVPSSAEQFYDAIDSIKMKKAKYGGNPAGGDVEGTSDRLQRLKIFLASPAGRYLHQQEAAAAAADPMIRRRKRDTASAVAPTVPAKTNSSSSASTPKTQMASDRKKRAFSDYFMWEKRREEPKDMYDYLTREYFKSIARTVGQKKRSYSQFEADKRSTGIEEFLENPSTLQYIQTELKEMEEEVAREAQETLKDERGDSQDLIDNIVVRLDALERMREALAQLEKLLEEKQSQRKRGGVPPGGRSQTRKRGLETRRKKASGDRMKVKRGSDLPDTFQGNTKEDCPVLKRILVNCEGASLVAGDEDQVFVQACIRHEVCYMCGSGLGISGHECDAILSSALEAACSLKVDCLRAGCSWKVDCLRAAGKTFDLLSNANRYDVGGTCTHDPCVRQLLESR